MFYGQDPDEIMIEYGLCSWCLGRGCPMCNGTGEHEDHEEEQKIEITSEYKKGQKGIIFLESVDPETDKPYFVIQLEDGKREVFFENEFKII